MNSRLSVFAGGRLMSWLIIAFSWVVAIDLYVDLSDQNVFEMLAEMKLGDNVLDFFAPKPQNDISVIMSQYKRNHSEEQLAAILTQTIPVTTIYIYQNENHLRVDFIHNVAREFCMDLSLQRCPTVKFLQNKEVNFPYHGRFTIPLLLSTEFVFIIDDDIVPGSRYLENCLRVTIRYNAVCGAAGQILSPTRKIMIYPQTSDDVEVRHLLHYRQFRISE